MPGSCDGRDKPQKDTLPEYLDPVDYLHWAFENGHVPHAMIGRSHGDLHGRNVLVGVQRGEVEQPALFDYGEMNSSNLLVWDFVKLESELKSRIMPDLFHNEPARKALADAVPPVRPGVLCRSATLERSEQEVADRADRLEFAFQFETLLAQLTHTVKSRSAAENPLPDDRRHPMDHPDLLTVDKGCVALTALRHLEVASVVLSFTDSWNAQRRFQTGIDLLHEGIRQMANRSPHVSLGNGMKPLATDGQIMQQTGCCTVGSRNADQQLMRLVSARRVARDGGNDRLVEAGIILV